MQCTVDPETRHGLISPLWFGHNLEHTRSCIWQGLSAQLIRNRKFAGLPQQLSGVAQDWYRIGPRESWHLLEVGDVRPGFGGHGGRPYTRHFDVGLAVKENVCQRQRIELLRRGEPCGIGQSGLTLVKGQVYDGRVVLMSDRDLDVTVRFSSGRSGQVWWECSSVVGPEAWELCDFSLTARQTETDVRIEITFDQVGVLYLGAVSLLPADHFHGMRPDVVELLKEISVPILRWPGGNFADDYHWKDGLLPVDQRVPLRSHMNETLPHSRDYDTHEIGTDEFIALCREIRAEPFIAINLGREGTAEAAAWYRAVGVAEGIFAAIMLHHFCRDARRLGITIGAFFEPVNEGAIWVDENGSQLTAMGQVFAALKPHQGRQLVDVSVNDEGSDLDMVSSLDEASGELFVSLVNRSASQDIDIDVALPTGWVGRYADGRLLSSVNYLPGSRFDETPLSIFTDDASALRLSLPKHSIATLTLARSAVDLC